MSIGERSMLIFPHKATDPLCSKPQYINLKCDFSISSARWNDKFGVKMKMYYDLPNNNNSDYTKYKTVKQL